MPFIHGMFSMSSASLERSKYGPGWFEILFVAWLSMLFGVLLAAVFLAFKPVLSGSKIPKDLPPGTLTYVEGSNDPQRGAGWLKKRQALMEGQSVELIEQEINVALLQAYEKQAKKNKPKKGEEPFLMPGSLNVRIQEGQFQLGWPIQVPMLERSVYIQTRGVFEKRGDVVAFVPERTYIGSLPLHLLPFVQAEVFKRLGDLHPKPADLVQAWSKVDSAVVEGKVLRLSVP